MTAVEKLQRSLPAGKADEVRDQYDERSPPDSTMRRLEERGQVRDRRAGQPGLADEILDESQDLDPAAARRDRALDPSAVEDRADTVAPPGQEPRQRRNEVDENGPLLAITADRSEIDGRAEVEQEPRRDLAVLVIFADIGCRHPRGHVPVDRANIVAELVFAKCREIEAAAAEQAPIIALEQAVQPANHLPVEALEDALRRGRGRHSGPGAGRPGRGRARRSIRESDLATRCR